MTSVAMQEQFVALLEQHRKILFKVAGSYCSDAEDRRDLAQEITVQLWRSFPRYDAALRFSTWMYRIAMNVAISFYRGQRSRIRDTVPVEGLLETLAATNDESSDELRLLHEAMAQLDPLNKSLLILYLDGNSHDTIAEVLGITATNVATRISRLKQQLRRELAG